MITEVYSLVIAHFVEHISSLHWTEHVVARIVLASAGSFVCFCQVRNISRCTELCKLIPQ